jgi:hypothetical protein
MSEATTKRAPVAAQDRLMQQALRDHGLTDAVRVDQDDVGGLLKEVQGEQPLEELAFPPWVSIKRTRKASSPSSKRSLIRRRAIGRPAPVLGALRAFYE